MEIPPYNAHHFIMFTTFFQLPPPGHPTPPHEVPGDFLAPKKSKSCGENRRVFTWRHRCFLRRDIDHMPIGSMGLVYLPTFG